VVCLRRLRIRWITAFLFFGPKKKRRITAWTSCQEAIPTVAHASLDTVTAQYLWRSSVMDALKDCTHKLLAFRSAVRQLSERNGTLTWHTSSQAIRGARDPPRDSDGRWSLRSSLQVPCGISAPPSISSLQKHSSTSLVSPAFQRQRSPPPAHLFSLTCVGTGDQCSLRTPTSGRTYLRDR
jgi:hypothetical protein